MYNDHDLPSVGDYVVFCGTVCLVKGVDHSRRLLTVEVRDVGHNPYISYIYAEDVDKFDIRSNKT
jgi:hypothetical protein